MFFVSLGTMESMNIEFIFNEKREFQCCFSAEVPVLEEPEEFPELAPPLPPETWSHEALCARWASVRAVDLMGSGWFSV